MPATATYRTPGVYVERLDANPQHMGIRRTDVAGFLGIAERGLPHLATKIESARQFLTTFGGRIAQAYLAYAVEGFFSNGGRTCWVVRVADPEQAKPARVRLRHSGCEPFILQAASPGVWGNRVFVEAVWGPDQIIALTATEQDRPPQTIELDPVSGQPPRSPSTEGNRTLLGVPESALPELEPNILVEPGSDDPRLPIESLGPSRRSARLTGGIDGVTTLRPEHFSGDPDGRALWGIDSLARVDGVSFVAAPDLMFSADPSAPDVDFKGFSQSKTLDAQIAILARCMGSRDRIAILDLPRADHGRSLNYRDDLPKASFGASSFGAAYHPWILVDDPLRIRSNVRAIPPSGHVAGMFARTDRLRGVHKPPANEVLEGVWDLTELLDDDAHASLNEGSINAIRAIPGRGVLVLGARTLDPDVHWRYVNVRRLFAMIEESLEEHLQWLTFEPNNPRLWKEVDRAVRGFLDRLYVSGLLDGATSEQAYFVRCDETTNPPADTDEGRVTCLLGVQPPYPAEFVIVRIGVTRSGIQIEEQGAQDV